MLLADQASSYGLRQNCQAIRAEWGACCTLRDGGQGNKFTPDDFLNLQAEWAVVLRAVDHDVGDIVGVGVTKRKELLNRDVYTQFFANFTPGALGKGFAGSQHAAHGDVPVRRKDVLGGGTQVNEDFAALIED